MKIILAKPNTEPEIMEVNSIQEVNALVHNINEDGTGYNDVNSDIRTPIGNGIDLYCKEDAMYNSAFEANLWVPGDAYILCGNIVFAGYNSGAANFGACSLTDEQIEYVKAFIRKQREGVLEMQKTYQEWCIDTIYNIVNAKKNYRGNMADQGYIYTIKSGIIGNYPSMYYLSNSKKCRNGKEHFNFWWDHLNRDNQRQAFQKIIMSVKAYEDIRNSIKNNEVPKGLKNRYHLEHITPNAYIYEKIIGLGGTPSKKDIKDCFKYSKIVLITKDEKDMLDGKGQKIEQEDLDYLNGPNYNFDTALIDDCKNIIGKSISSNGYGPIRMAHLFNRGVEFCKLNGDLTYKDLTSGECFDYLREQSSKEYTI